MRVTNTMLTNTFLRNLRFNLRRLQEAQDRLASGKEVRRPSDDPVRVVDALALRSDLGEISQYTRNVEDAKTWLEVTDSALAEATNVLQRARELALYGANDTMPQESRQALAEEVKQLKEQLGLIANTTLGGRYIFGGTNTATEPVGSGYSPVTWNWEKNQWENGSGWNGNKDPIEYEVSPRVTLPVNFPGMDLFHAKISNGTVEEPGAIAVLQKLAEALENKSGTEISQCVADLDKIIDKILATRGELGARVNRVEMLADRLQQSKVLQTELLSVAEDADIAEVILDLKNQENVYRACLATGARILPPSLVDFLR